MQFILNGQSTPLPQNLSFLELLEQHQINPEQVAVARNGEVLLRSELAKTLVQTEDQVEIFHAVGGG